MAPDVEAEVLDASATQNLSSIDGYRGLLEAHGFIDIASEDTSDQFVATYREVMARLATLEVEIGERFSPKVFAIVAEKNGSILQAFENGHLGGGSFVARHPSES